MHSPSAPRSVASAARALAAAAFLAPLAAVACGRDADRAAPAPAASSSPPPTAAASDSATSMTALLRRFQEATPDRPTELAGFATSREELARRFAAAVERRDTAALDAMRLTRGEFAHLFFPSSIFMRPPYELPPDVVWMQTDAESATGLRRALREWGGRPVGYAGLACQPAPQEHGPARLWGCDVRRRTASGDTVTARMFGAILERDGKFKFFSYANRL